MSLNILNNFINIDSYPIDNVEFIESCKNSFFKNGVLAIPNFINDESIKKFCIEAEKNKYKAYFTKNTHNVFLTPIDNNLPKEHIYNFQLSSSKGCITTDQIPKSSGLKIIYNSVIFKNFISKIVCEKKLYEYADPLSSINIHYANKGQELGWHFDNSNFAVTLLLQKPNNGGIFKYAKDVRNLNNKVNYEGIEKIIHGKVKPSILDIKPGTLVLFRGKNSMHKVTPTIGDKTRFLVVFAYNSKPGISLSKSAQKTFFGRIAS